MEHDYSDADLELDTGELHGGFARAYDVRILRPDDSPMVRRIERLTGADKARWTELRLEISTGTTIKTAMIPCGGWSVTKPCLFTTPNPNVFGLRGVFGLGYFVDTRDLRRIEILPQPLKMLLPLYARALFVLASSIRLSAFDGYAYKWHSSRDALDGISRLVHDDAFVHGMTTKSPGGSHSFSVDIETGAARGGFCGMLPDD